MTSDQRKEYVEKLLRLKSQNVGHLEQETPARSHLSDSLSGCDLTELPRTVVKDIWAQANIILERYHVLALENATFCVY